MTDLEIVNTALGRIGQSPIANLGQNIGTGLLAQQNYNHERDSLLRKIPWSFARKWIALPNLAVAPLMLDIMPNSASPGSVIFTAAYQLPNDCLRVYRFSPREAHWRIVGRQIYTDAVPATNLGALLGLQPIGSDGPSNQPMTPTNIIPTTLGIEYIRKVEDTTIFDELFTETLIWKFAKDLSFGVSGLIEMFKLADAEYTKSVADAAAVNGMENWPDEFYNTDLTDVRYGYTGLSIEGI